MKTDYAIEIPWVMGLIATRSVDADHRHSIWWPNTKSSPQRIQAYAALQQVRANPDDADARARLMEHHTDSGYGLLVKAMPGWWMP